jgi:L-arabinose isomerase
MREVAVTEGDKVEAQIRLGYDVYGYAAADLAARLDQVSAAEAQKLVAEYDQRYSMDKSLRQGGERRGELEQAARLEAGMRAFLEEGGFKAFTTNFEHLHGLPQLPGLAVQRLMAAGYGFGAEGDWKTAALVRAGSGRGLPGVRHEAIPPLDPDRRCWGAHGFVRVHRQAASRPKSIQFIPGKRRPRGWSFSVGAGPAVGASLIDLGSRPLVVNEVEAVAVKEALPRLPVAIAVWVPKPDLKTAAAAWILAGGAHHTAFSQAVGTEHLEDFARIAGIELALIDAGTTLRQFERELGWEEMHPWPEPCG